MSDLKPPTGKHAADVWDISRIDPPYEPRHCFGRPTMLQRVGAAAVSIEDAFNIVRVDDFGAGVSR